MPEGGRRAPTGGRMILIGNPAAGRGRGAAAMRSAEAALRARGVGVEVRATGRPGEAVALAREAARSGADLLLVAGGDGTLRDVVEGLGGADLPVGLLPVGTGNDLARMLGVPRALPRALEIALAGEERRLDVWHWNGRPFVNVAGVGLDAAVAEAVNRRFRRLRGPVAYLAAVCAVLPRFRPFPLRIEAPGVEWAGRVWLAAAANGCCYGGGLRIAPAARPDDGLLDVVVVEGVGRLELLRQFPGLWTGAHVKHPAVRIIRAGEVRLEAPPEPAMLDGEPLARTPATVRRAPAAEPGGPPATLRLRVPSVREARFGG